MGIILGLVGDPRLGDLRDPEWRKRGLVEIPAGRYAYQDGHQEIPEPFWIGRYPVTNGQFALFIKEEGYQNQQYWSDDGWAWREADAVTEPLSWHDNDFNASNQPVVGVSYWEAEAFCRWAGERLPTEREWEAAARGPEGHEYPWGEPWEDGICNSYGAGLSQTSPVGLFPRSRQKALGIEDLAGNVWEWCDQAAEPVSASGSGVESRVLRGGSWGYYQDDARAAYRLEDHPDDRNNDVGFRVLCESPIR